MTINAKINLQADGGNAYFILDRDGSPIGKAIWDPARGQFAFLPEPVDLVLDAATLAAVVTTLNGLSKNPGKIR